MEDGAVVLHQAERKVHRLLHGLIMNCALETSVTSNTESLLVAGSDGTDLWPVVDTINTLQASIDQLINHKSTVTSFTLPQEVDPDIFNGCGHILLCEDASAWKDNNSRDKNMHKLCTCLKLALKAGGHVCLGIKCKPSDFRSHLSQMCQDFPEFRWLQATKRIINIEVKEGKWNIDSATKEKVLYWLTMETATEQYLEYSDMGQIVWRDLRRLLPDPDTFVRLTLLCLFGVAWVFLTAVFLIALSADNSPDRTLRVALTHVRGVIVGQRRGKSEWGQGHDAAALLALQLSEPDWCFQGLDNQRSIDRLEIHLLAAISRSRQTGSRDLTLARLAQYINALWVTYQNPRDFHGHDLVSLLERNLLQQAPYILPGVYANSLAVLALANSGVDVDRPHVSTLLRFQKQNGRFGTSVDETALACLALTCLSEDDDEPELNEAFNKTLTYLLASRRQDGSYGSLYATALVMQAFNASELMLPSKHQEITKAWLIMQARRHSSIKNIDIAAQVLIALSEKSLVSVRNFTGMDRILRREMGKEHLRAPRGVVPLIQLNWNEKTSQQETSLIPHNYISAKNVAPKLELSGTTKLLPAPTNISESPNVTQESDHKTYDNISDLGDYMPDREVGIQQNITDITFDSPTNNTKLEDGESKDINNNDDDSKDSNDDKTENDEQPIYDKNVKDNTGANNKEITDSKGDKDFDSKVEAKEEIVIDNRPPLMDYNVDDDSGDQYHIDE